MKLVLRLIVKIAVTPIVLINVLLMLLVGYGFVFYDWLWEVDEFERMITRETIADLYLTLKNWFTTI